MYSFSHSQLLRHEVWTTGLYLKLLMRCCTVLKGLIQTVCSRPHPSKMPFHCLVCLSFEPADLKRFPLNSSCLVRRDIHWFKSCSRLLCNLHSLEVRLNHCTITGKQGDGICCLASLFWSCLGSQHLHSLKWYLKPKIN